MATKETSLKRCIEDISAKNTDYKFPEQAINQAESLKSLSSDLYTDNIRFIYELIQNADDAQAKNIILTILADKYFIIAHDGKAFDEKDLQGLCGVNNGTKKKDLDKTGYKGLGFKAVFGKSDYVMIYSHGEYFRFDASHKIKWNQEWGMTDQQTWEQQNDRKFIYPWQINPIWTNENEVPKSIKDFFNQRKKQMCVAYAISLKNIREIHPAIIQLKQQPYMFLFLRNISEMTFSTQTNDTITIARDRSYGLKQVYINKKIDSQWIIKRIELDVPVDIQNKLADDTKAPDKLRFLKKAEIFFAAKYKDENAVATSGGIEKLRDQDSILFSYLPTKILEYKFPVLINANFLTNVNREQIHTDSPWNQWLFDKIGSEIFHWIKELVKNKQFGFQAYRLIPSRLTLINNILSKQFNRSFETSIRSCNFILNRENQLLKVNEVIMDMTSMSKQASFINIDSMRQYITNNDSQFDDHPFIDYDPNLEQIGVMKFTWIHCIDMFKSDIFLRTHLPEQNKRMIEYFYSKCSTGAVEIDIEQIPFLLDQNNRLQLIKNIYFPAETIGDSGTGDSDDLFVNKIIFNWLNEKAQRGIKQWLQNLGVEERSDLAFLRKTIIPNASTYSTKENTMKTIKMLFILFQKGDIDKEILNKLRKLKLLTTRGRLIPAEECFFSDQYKPRLSLEEYLKTEEDKFLSFDYVLSDIRRKENEDLVEWRGFFMMLGVHEELHPIIFNQKLTSYEASTMYGFLDEYLLTTSPDRKHTVDAFSGLITITFMQHTSNNYAFAKFFWSYVIKNIKPEELMQKVRIYWGHAHRPGAINGTIINDANYVAWFIKNIKCIPTTSKTCELASNILINNKELEKLCGQYMCFSSISLPQDKTPWHGILNFKTKLSGTDYFDLLQKIRRDEKNLKDNLDRIQMIYSHIFKEMHSWTSDEQKTLQTRVNSLHLLTENDQWKPTRDLFFYMESTGVNNNMNDAIPCLKLDYKNRNQQHLNQFLDFFNIQKIRPNDLKLADKQSSPAEHFRRKLIEISPFLKKWLKDSSVSSDIISSIDKKIQQENDFIESDRLQLFFNQEFFQETNVYFDIHHRQLYVRRPWDSETTFIDLPNKLCQLLNIRGFEQNIRFLLKGTIEEIRKHFYTNSIEIPTKEDIVILEPLLKTADVVQRSKPSPAPSTEPKQSTTPRPEIKKSVAPPPEPKKPVPPVKNKETNSNQQESTAKPAEASAINSINQMYNADAVLHLQQPYPNYPYPCQFSPYGMIPVPIQGMHPSIQNLGGSISSNFIQSPVEQYSSMKVIDIASITTTNSVLYPSLLDGTGDSEALDLITGRIGEEMVYRHLLNEHRDHLNLVSIEWKNRDSESYSPYDISLTINGKTQYIEVKSTRTYNQHMFPLSINQIESFLRHKENYFIYRVYIEENQFNIIDNIRWRLIQKQQLACFLRILPISSN